MTKISRCAMALVVAVPSRWAFFVYPASAQEHVPKSVDEAKQIAESIGKATERPGRMPPTARATLVLPLLPFLDSKEGAVRAVAVEFFRKTLLRTEVVLDRCLPYLDHSRAEDERMPLLAVCVDQFSSDYTDGHSSRDAQDKVKSLAREALNAEVCPACFVLLAAALTHCDGVFRTSRGHCGFRVKDMISKETERIVAARLLASLAEVDKFFRRQPGVAENGGGRKVFEMVLSLDERCVGQVLCDWYRVESQPLARAVVVDTKVSWPEAPEWRVRRRTLLEIASKDWDREMADGAKALLAQ